MNLLERFDCASQSCISPISYFPDGQVTMPHFSQKDLVSRFAHEETLNFTYYLRQGRPSFAFCALVLEQIKKGARSLTHKWSVVE